MRQLKAFFVVMLIGFFLYSCGFGLASGWHAGEQPQVTNHITNYNTTEVLSHNFDNWFSGNTTEVLSRDSAHTDGGGLLIVGGVIVTLIILLGGKRGG